MKKKTALFCALIALVSCNIETLGPETPSDGKIKVNLTIGRADDFTETKATVKSTWADDDVVFVFFKGVAAPKYLEMKYSGGSWTATGKNGLAASDLSDAADKRMTAIYLPYGSTATVVNDGGAFKFQDGFGNDLFYKGYFLQAELVDYTFAGELKGTLNMVAPALANLSDKLIHFDISGFTAGHDYALYQDYVKPLTFGSVSADGIVSKTEGSMRKPLTGYADGSMMSFSGILDASAVDVAKNYHFSVWDDTAGKLYTREASTKTVSKAMYIGIGDISAPATWNVYEQDVDFVYLGFNNASGERIMWARKNLGATVEQGEGSYGLYYAWGETTGHSLTGTFGTYTCDHNFNTDMTVAWDASRILLPEYDAAHVALKGIWRLPTNTEFESLKSNTDNPGFSRGSVNSGKTWTSTVPGYESKSVFLPAAGSIYGTTLYVNEGSSGGYWTSYINGDGHKYWYQFSFSNGSNGTNYGGGSQGYTIRPVFSVE